MMRLYYKTDGTDLRTDINKLNYDIAKRVIESFPMYEQAILTDILLPDRPIHKNVENVSIEYNIAWQTNSEKCGDCFNRIYFTRRGGLGFVKQCYK